MTEWPETAVRCGATLACLGCLVGLAATLSVPPGWLWTVGAVLFGVAAVWLWRRWLDRWEIARARAQHTPEYPVAAPDPLPDSPQY